MDIDSLYGANYSGTNTFVQHPVRVADANSMESASDDFAEKSIDLNEKLIYNKPATFFLRVSGDAMVGAGIHDGDLVIVDRSIQPQNGKVVIAVLHGDMLIRRFEKTFNKMRLVPETTRLAPIDIDPCCEDFGIWGVVTFVVHALN